MQNKLDRKSAFSLTQSPIEAETLRSFVEDERAGAVSTFEGIVRNHNEGKAVRGLYYEGCESLAQAEAQRILEEAHNKFPLLGAVACHRLGELSVGDMAVYVAVSSAHRDEAFSACRYIIDEIKHRLPIWKKEHYIDGAAHWVNCAACSSQTQEPEHTHITEHTQSSAHTQEPEHTHITERTHVPEHTQRPELTKKRAQGQPSAV
jgi:molybdopterin synthase catalytic subunit